MGLEWIGQIELVKLAKEENKDYGLKYSFLRNQAVEKKEFGGSAASGCMPGCGTQSTTVEPFETTVKGDIKWFSFGGEYFTTLLIPPPSKEITLSLKGTEKYLLKADVTTSPISIPPGEKVNAPYQIYLGPKDENLLKRLGEGVVIRRGHLFFDKTSEDADLGFAQYCFHRNPPLAADSSSC